MVTDTKLIAKCHPYPLLTLIFILFLLLITTLLVISWLQFVAVCFVLSCSIIVPWIFLPSYRTLPAPPPPSLIKFPISFLRQTGEHTYECFLLQQIANGYHLQLTTDLYWLSSSMAGWIVETWEFPVWMWCMCWLKGNPFEDVFVIWFFFPCLGQTSVVTVVSNNQVFSFPLLAKLPITNLPISSKSGDAEWTTIICMSNANETMETRKIRFDLSQFGNYKEQRDFVVRTRTSLLIGLVSVWFVHYTQIGTHSLVVHLTSLTSLVIISYVPI